MNHQKEIVKHIAHMTVKIKQKSNVDHPDHYNHIEGVECIDVVEQMTFNLGNACKYIWRCGHKGNKIEDLQKAIWYINREIARTQRLEKPTIENYPGTVSTPLECDHCGNECS